jgi:hypothetical protein
MSVKTNSLFSAGRDTLLKMKHQSVSVSIRLLAHIHPNIRGVLTITTSHNPPRGGRGGTFVAQKLMGTSHFLAVRFNQCELDLLFVKTINSEEVVVENE